MPCHEDECQCKRNNVPTEQRVLCKHWYPSQGSKYFTCEWYELERQPCPFEGSPCETCQYYCKLETRGRPNKSGIDWTDPEQVKGYRRSQRAKHKPTGGTE